MARFGSLCVYCGASGGVPEAHRNAASALGRLIAEAGIRLIFGGGRVGLMGLAADAALAAGGEVVGIIPGFLEAIEIGHRAATTLEVTDSMHARKARMAELADAFVVLPGGFGTLDEMFEIVTWRQLGLHGKPVLLVDVEGYWQPLIALLRHMVAAGYARPEALTLVTLVARVEDVLPTLARLPAGKPLAMPDRL